MKTREREKKTRIRQDGNKIKGNPNPRKEHKKGSANAPGRKAVVVDVDTEVWSVEKAWSVSQLGYVEGAICREKEECEYEDGMKVRASVQP
jgi:hypothetical protein